MNRTDSRIYRYVVRYDGGTAPRPFDGICSLAICKPGIRRGACPGDWVVGFRSCHPGEVLYAMRVDEVLSLGDYWLDARFANRKPDATGYPDNIYKCAADGALIQVPNDVHSRQDAAKDIDGRNVLLARTFWYFGRNSVPTPGGLRHLVHAGRHYSVHKNRRVHDVDHLERWLTAWEPGMHGGPIDAAETGLAECFGDVPRLPVKKGRRGGSCKASGCGP